ncbi:MAG: hypothetical protein RMJ28_06885 [Nitrososphaerota archaeon]|nr:hypothetical protein [Candidatus Calditenuaceae archaeon]MDW8073938.1 hypothetical protein [Nitrososphaerota archaeon]
MRPRRQMLITLGLLFPPHLLFILFSLGDYLKEYLGWLSGRVRGWRHG